MARAVAVSMHFRGRHPLTSLVAQLTQLTDVQEVRVRRAPMSGAIDDARLIAVAVDASHRPCGPDARHPRRARRRGQVWWGGVRARRGVAGTSGRTGRRRRHRLGHVVSLEQADPRRTPLPGDARLRARRRGPARTPAAAQRRRAPPGEPGDVLVPAARRGWERAYVGAGLQLYDGLARWRRGAAAQQLPRHRHLSRRGVERVAAASGLARTPGASSTTTPRWTTLGSRSSWPGPPPRSEHAS